MRSAPRFLALLVFISAALRPGYAADAAADFAQTVRPVLQQNCVACHNPVNPKNRINFLKAQSAQDIESQRGLWRDVAAQLRNRTMPPVASKLTEQDRLHIASWIDNRLRETACRGEEYAGAVPPRRLNRREYHNTVRDLLGVDFNVSDLFPTDESGGAGFDTNGETLFIPPVMLERYLEAAQKIVDRAIITPPFVKVIPSIEMQPPAAPGKKLGRPLAPAQEVTTSFTAFTPGAYDLKILIDYPPDAPRTIEVKVDGGEAAKLTFNRDPNGGTTTRARTVTLTRGAHTVTINAGPLPIWFYSLTVDQKPSEIVPERRMLHYRLLGVEPGESPLDPRRSAQRLLSSLLPKAYRHPVDAAEINRFLSLYDRAAERGDPFEERLKLMLKGVLISPRFLFHVEDRRTDPGISPLNSFDMASRLSYFFWATMPDDELLRLAADNRLQDPKTLTAQVGRLLDDPRSRAFANAFVGQWLGTQDVGGRVVPLLTELQNYYTPEVAADLREEPVLLFQHILAENRPITELLTANYSYLTPRLARFYQIDAKTKPLAPTGFQRVEWPDDRRAGILGMASVLAMTSHYQQSSPVLRGAWVLDTLLGTPVPPPPPDVPPLETASKNERGFTIRQSLLRHRADPSCSTCHNLMDPIGFGLENFDWMGRWRDNEPNGTAIDASGVLPSGETFTGPQELRHSLLQRKDEFIRHLTAKTLGYALGRNLQDGDACTIQKITDALAKDDYRMRTLIREVVLSSAFRSTQGGINVDASAAPVTKRQKPREVH